VPRPRHCRHPRAWGILVVAPWLSVRCHEEFPDDALSEIRCSAPDYNSCLVGAYTPRGASAAHHLLQLFGVSRALHGDFGGRGLDVAEIIGRKLDGCRFDVFLEPVKFRGAGDRNDPRLLGDEPRKRDLGRCRLLAPADAAEQVDQRLIGFAGFRREAGERRAKVGAGECRVFVDFSGEEALAERAVGNEADAKFGGNEDRT
jgi:hypothetical protein